MDPDQTAPTGPYFLSMRRQKVSGQQKTYSLCLCTLRFNKCEFSVYTVRIFMKCMHVCAAQKPYQFFTKLQIKPDFPS